MSLELWAFDEHRLGLKPVKRRCWAPLGSRLVAPVHPRYQWLYVQAFVKPQSGESVFWLTSCVDTELFSKILAAFAQERKLSKTRWALIVLDQAGWHLASDLELPDGVILVFLPAYSPELQPAERLWPLIDVAVANTAPLDEQALWRRLDKQCVYLGSRPELVQAHTCFHWWPATIS